MVRGMSAVSQSLQSFVLSGLHVLVVDDSEHVRDALASTLEFFGAIATTAESAAEARSVLARSIPDAILSDLNMPDEDGCTFIATLRASENAARYTPAAVVTASHDAGDHARAIASGFSFVVEKPFELEDIARAVLLLCSN